ELPCRQAGCGLCAVEAQTPSELEAALVTLTKERVGAVIVIADAFFNSQRRRLRDVAPHAPTRRRGGGGWPGGSACSGHPGGSPPPSTVFQGPPAPPPCRSSSRRCSS